MNIDEMTAVELIDTLIQEINEHGIVGLQFEQDGPVIVCTVENYEDINPSNIELTSTKPLH